MVKRKSLLTLLILDICIIITGICFSIYSVKTSLSYLVLRAEVPGVIFGLITIFLGIRYLVALRRLENRIASIGTGFRWENFKKAQPNSSKSLVLHKKVY